MKRFAALFVLLFVAGSAWSANNANPIRTIGNTNVLYVQDTDIDDAFEIVDADTGFTPLQANSPIRVYYHGASTDTVQVHVVGLRADSTFFDTLMNVGGQVVTSTAATAMAFEQAWVDTEKASATIVYSGASSSANRLRDIGANALFDPIPVVYAGKRSVTLEAVEFSHESPTDTLTCELRVYSDIRDDDDLGDGYVVRASARLHAGHPRAAFHDLGITMPPASLAAVFSRAESGSVRGVTGSTIMRYRR